MFYEITPSGAEICWAFESNCEYKGECKTCPKLDEYCNQPMYKKEEK